MGLTDSSDPNTDSYISFQSFRTEGFPSRYDDQQLVPSFDLSVIRAYVVLAFLGVALGTTLLGYSGKERTAVLIRSAIALFIGFSIGYCLLEHGWEEADSGSVPVNLQYTRSIATPIPCRVGLYIGFYGVNVTLIGYKPKGLKHQDVRTSPEDELDFNLADWNYERIYYNEHFPWYGLQGQAGFGSQAGEFNKAYREALQRGVPYPILDIAEYFTFDDEGLRFGRFYRLAGWYASFCLWLSVPLFVISLILLPSVLQVGTRFLALTGLVLLTANIVWSCVRNIYELEIPLTDLSVSGTGQTAEVRFLTTHYGPCYWLNLTNSLICILSAVMIWIFDLLYPDETATFFGQDPVEAYEEIFAEIDDTPPSAPKGSAVPQTPPALDPSQLRSGPTKGLNALSRLSRANRSTLLHTKRVPVLSVTNMATPSSSGPDPEYGNVHMFRNQNSLSVQAAENMTYGYLPTPPALQGQQPSLKKSDQEHVTDVDSLPLPPPPIPPNSPARNRRLAEQEDLYENVQPASAAMKKPPQPVNRGGVIPETIREESSKDGSRASVQSTDL